MKRQLQNDVDVLGLLTKIQDQLTTLDKKVDFLMNKTVPQPAQAKPVPQPAFAQSNNVHVHRNERPGDFHKGRPMYRATCADCKKECEIPFKPTGDRPMYCKECFMRRKTNNTLKINTDNKPVQASTVQALIKTPTTVAEPPAKEKKKPVAVKSSGGKKKLGSKKKRK